MYHHHKNLYLISVLQFPKTLQSQLQHKYFNVLIYPLDEMYSLEIMFRNKSHIFRFIINSLSF
jgi:hypothetical protein